MAEENSYCQELVSGISGQSPQQLAESGNQLSESTFFTPHQGWIIGPYEDLTGPTGLAQRLRHEPSLSQRLSIRNATVAPGEGDGKLAHQLIVASRIVTFGRREGEIFLPGENSAGLFPLGERTVTSFRGAIKDQPAKAVSLPVGQQVRKTQKHEVTAEYFRQATFEANHIVEKSILAIGNANSGVLQNDLAPCMLVSRGMHVFITEQMRPVREEVAKMKGEKQLAFRTLHDAYDKLYSGPVMKEPQLLAHRILEKAESMWK